jgi:hypothetical protein
MVKQERRDDDDPKIREYQEAQLAAIARHQAEEEKKTRGRPPQRGAPGAPLPPKVAPPVDDDVAIDLSSAKGQFGWMELFEQHVPYIFRQVSRK